jgi:hypothetical protein
MADDDGHHRPSLFLPEPRSVIPVAGTLEVLGTFIKPLHAEATLGETLEQILGRLTNHPEWVRVHIVTPSGKAYGPIPRAAWSRIRPKLGRRVVGQVIPGSAGGQTDSAGNGVEKDTAKLIIEPHRRARRLPALRPGPGDAGTPPAAHARRRW